MNKKRVWRIVRIVVIIIVSIPVLLYVVLFVWGALKSFKGTKIIDLEDYISERYLSFPGGKEMRDCIPTYEELGDYESIFFGYYDGRAQNFLNRRHYISVGVRVKYSEEEYFEKKRQAGLTGSYTEYPELTETYKFVEEGGFNHVLYGAEYIDTLNMIEYVAICGDFYEEDEGAIKGVEGTLWHLISRNSPF